MKLIGDLAIEGKVGIIIGFLAFLFSLLTGIIAGIKFYHVFLRSVIMGPVFGVIGLSLVLVLKKFVPEIYDAISSSMNKIETGIRSSDMPDLKIKDDEMADAQEKAVFSEQQEARPEKAEPPYENIQKVPSDDSFTEFSPNDFSKVSVADGQARAEGSQTMDKGKLGKHLFSKENVVKYEPKVMAQAIRSMISKDD